MSGVHRLTGVVRPYAWGSRTIIAELQGRPAPSEGPEAELWLGAHPGDPSTVEDHDGPVGLPDLIAADPVGQLGQAVVERFGPRLPYLMKVLAAETPLSLQAHPDLEYAREAFAAQEADPSLPRNYTDGNHKPEMLVAVTEFRALCGFQEPDVSATVLESFDVPALAPVVAALRAGVSGLSEAVRLLLTWPEDDRKPLIESVLHHARPGDLVHELAQHYPADPGVLVALLLNHVTLQPGEAIWMPAGNLHAYLHGAGVEIMAASDNVLRGGLTPKRVDVDELLKVLRFEVLRDPIFPATPVAPGVDTWRVPIEDFALYRVILAPDRPPTRLPVEGPRIILGIEGETHVAEDHGTPVGLTPATAAYAPAAAGPISVAGTGTIFIAAAG